MYRNHHLEAHVEFKILRRIKHDVQMGRRTGGKVEVDEVVQNGAQVRERGVERNKNGRSETGRSSMKFYAPVPMRIRKVRSVNVGGEG